VHATILATMLLHLGVNRAVRKTHALQFIWQRATGQDSHNHQPAHRVLALRSVRKRYLISHLISSRPH
jgi:hypothetical protein